MLEPTRSTFLDVMNSKPDAHGNLTEDAIAYFVRGVSVMARFKARQLMSGGETDAATRRQAFDAVIDRSLAFMAVDEYRRERVAVAAQRAIEDELQKPPRPPLDEATRRRPGWKAGATIRLTDKQEWTFPDVEIHELDVDVPRDLVAFNEAISDADVPESSRLAARITAAVLSMNYDLDDMECLYLMPLAITHPDCLGAIGALIPTELLDSTPRPFTTETAIELFAVAGIPINEIFEAIAVGCLRPLFRKIESSKAD